MKAVALFLAASVICDPPPPPAATEVASLASSVSQVFEAGDACGTEPDSALLLDFTFRLSGSGSGMSQGEAKACLDGLWAGAQGSLRSTLDGLKAMARGAASGLPYILLGGPMLGPMTYEAHELYVAMKDPAIRAAVEPLVKSCIANPLGCQELVERSFRDAVQRVIQSVSGAANAWIHDELAAYRCMDGAGRQRLACEVNGVLFTEAVSLIATEGAGEALKLIVSSTAKVEQLAAKLSARGEAIGAAVERALAKDVVVLTAKGPSREALAGMLKLDPSQVASFGKGGQHLVFSVETPAGQAPLRFSTRNFRIPKELAGQPADQYVFKVAKALKPGSKMAARDAEMFAELGGELKKANAGIEMAETHFAEDSAGNQVIVQRKIAGKTPEEYTAEVFRGVFDPGKGSGKVSVGQAEDILRQLINGEPVEAVGASPRLVAKALAENPDYQVLIDRLRVLKKLDAESPALKAVDARLGDNWISSRLPWMHESAPVRIDVAGRNLRIVGEPGKTRLVIFDY